ncbi:MAG: HlyD family efflux transporter periplasmic adaptor subunit [Rhodocyclaceae bacterium]|nr:HlyD family efflux transporter periplasmic adaptor subunit [Rhodocyclaceae bacterium]
MLSSAVAAADGAIPVGRPAQAAPVPWPELREELRLHRAGDNPDGSPAWHVADPVANRYCRIGWLEFEMLARWHLGDAAQIAAQIRADTVLQVEPADVEAFGAFLRAQQLLRALPARALPPRFGWRWWLQHYLFVRIPLVRPARVLVWLAPRLEMLWTRGFLLLTVFAGTAGLLLAARQWDEVRAGAGALLSWQGGATLLVALAFSKLVHELAHALTATRYGVRVGHMGIALVVLWPMAYTDTGEGWKLTRARHRMAIASAGIVAELALAAWATLAWCLLPDGPLRHALFLLATTSWTWTLLVNASPFMRFDGYFILCDWLDFPALHERAGAHARRWLRRVVLGLEAPVPESLPPGRGTLLVAFALVTWLYRLVVFVGIALLVYHLFFKALGILLFAVELWVFIGRPVATELRAWWQQRAAVRRSRVLVLLLAIGLPLIALLLPWPTRVQAPGVLRSAGEQAVYAPYAGRIERLSVSEGQAVQAGDVLAELHAPREDDERRRALAVAEGYRRAAGGAVGLDQDGAARQVIADRQSQRWRAEAGARATELARLRIVAEHTGAVRDVDPLLAPGSWVDAATPIAWLVYARGWQVEALVAEADLSRIEAGAAVTVIVAGSGHRLSGRLTAIDGARVQRLPHRLLADGHGGPVEVLPAGPGGGLAPVDALYRVVIEGDDPLPGRVAVRRVAVHIDARPDSPGRRWLSAIAAALFRQGAF